MSRLQGLLALVLGAAAGLCLLAAGCDKVSTLAPSTAAITLFANPLTVAVGGTANLTVSVFETSGQPVPDDTEITLTSTLGTVDPAQVKTRGGFAQATFRAGSAPGSAAITASSGSAKAGTLTLTVGSAAQSLSLSASPASLPVGGGSSRLTARVIDASGTAVAGVRVNFTSDRGSLASGGGPVTTDARGEASDTLSTTVDAMVTATVAGGGVSGTATVDVAGSGAATLTLTASPELLGPGGGSSTLAAAVADASGSPVGSFAVAFTTSAGSLATTGPVRTGSDGIARNTLSTTTTATVRAAGAGVSGSATVSVGRPTPGSIGVTLAVSPAEIVKAAITPTPTPVSTCGDPTGFDVTLTATVTSGGAAVSGALVSFFTGPPSATRARVPGRFCETPQVVTDAAGTAVVHYTISADERSTCDSISLPCAGATCAGTTPCGTPTPPVSATQLNDCCCGIVFTARVGSAQAQAPSPAFSIYAERDCPIKPCACTF